MIALRIAPHRIDRIFAANETTIKDSSYSYSAHRLPSNYRMRQPPDICSENKVFELSAQNLEYSLLSIVDQVGSKRVLEHESCDQALYFQYEPGGSTCVSFNRIESYWVRQTPEPTVWLEHGYDLEPCMIYRSVYTISDKLTTSQMVFKEGRIVFACYRYPVAMDLPDKKRVDRPLKFVWYKKWDVRTDYRLRNFYTPIRSSDFSFTRYFQTQDEERRAAPVEWSCDPTNWSHDMSFRNREAVRLISNDIVEVDYQLAWNLIDLTEAESTDMFFVRVSGEPLIASSRQPHYEPRTISTPVAKIDRPNGPPAIRAPFLAGLMLWVRTAEQIKQGEKNRLDAEKHNDQMGLPQIIDLLRLTPCQYFAIGCFTPSHMGQISNWTDEDVSVLSVYDTLWLEINPLWRKTIHGKEKIDRSDLGRYPRPVL